MAINGFVMPGTRVVVTGEIRGIPRGTTATVGPRGVYSTGRDLNTEHWVDVIFDRNPNGSSRVQRNDGGYSPSSFDLVHCSPGTFISEDSDERFDVFFSYNEEGDNWQFLYSNVTLKEMLELSKDVGTKNRYRLYPRKGAKELTFALTVSSVKTL